MTPLADQLQPFHVLVTGTAVLDDESGLIVERA